MQRQQTIAFLRVGGVRASMAQRTQVTFDSEAMWYPTSAPDAQSIPSWSRTNSIVFDRAEQGGSLWAVKLP